MANGETLSLEQALAAQKALRDALGLPPERFPIPAFVGMVSDEIEKLRAAGRSDEEIAAVVEQAIGLAIAPDEIARHYAPPGKRACG